MKDMSEEMEENSYDSEEEYYIRAFKRLDETGKQTWNWAAFFFSGSWMAYRKMYLYSFLFKFSLALFAGIVLFFIAFFAYGKFVYGDLHSLLKTGYPVIYWSFAICFWIFKSIGSRPASFFNFTF